jgi:DNA-binding ferritin-like protein (Dps family)
MTHFRRPDVKSEEKFEAHSPGAWRSSRFQPIEDTIHNESMEDRIMGKVRAKVNKLGHSTYDSTKAFMKQILDSGETDFLEEFMRFVFGKAATEPAFCGLYARFLHELADEFPHLRNAMVRKFREYTRVFDEASQAPDVGTSDYTAFVEAQEQKKFRRGYSQFVAELAKLGEVSMEDFRLLVNRVVETIQVCHVKEENRVMCEEIIDCFMVMVRAAKVDWMREYVETLRSVVAAPKDAAPGLSNKGRFAIMDILDLVKRR